MPDEIKEGLPVSNELDEVEVVVDQEGSENEQDDDLENYSASVNKRINKLTAKMREAERREQAALEYAQSLQQQAEQRIAQETEKSNKLDQYYVNEFENRLSTQNQLLQDKLKEAIDRGDSEGQVTLQKQLADLASQETRMKQVKQQQAQRQQQAQYQQQQAAQQAQYQQQQAQYQQQQVIQQAQQTPPDPKAEQWANKNEWFGEDEAMTITAFSIHKALIEEEGMDPQSEDYYNALDDRIRQEFPHKFDGATVQKTSSSSPRVAGATRSSPSRGRKSIKLNPSQVAIAKKLNVPLDKYAAQLERMNNS
tara:strand:- start:71 stop:997 length:927 start_codon:yes stop_codon:yes gene_type:complete